MPNRLLRELDGQNDITFRFRNSIDQHSRKGSNAKYTCASTKSIVSLNHQLRERQKYYFIHGLCINVQYQAPICLPGSSSNDIYFVSVYFFNLLSNCGQV